MFKNHTLFLKTSLPTWEFMTCCMSILGFPDFLEGIIIIIGEGFLITNMRRIRVNLLHRLVVKRTDAS